MYLEMSSIKPDPHNVRSGGVGDLSTLMANMSTIGLLNPIGVVLDGEGYRVVHGHRRFAAAQALGWTSIRAECMAGTEAELLAAQTAENMLRADLRPVEQWRAVKRLMDGGASLPAAAITCGVTERQAKQLQVMGSLLPAMLDYIEATDDMPGDHYMRTIALAAHDKQAAVWKKQKPKKGDTHISWYEVAAALRVQAIGRKLALFDDEVARLHGVTWQTDWLAPPENADHTENVDGFRGAQREWLEKVTIPALQAKGIHACMGVATSYGEVEAPKKAYPVVSGVRPDEWHKTRKGATLAFIVRPDGDVRATAWEMPKVEKKAAATPGDAPAEVKSRPDGREIEAAFYTNDGLKVVEAAKRAAIAGAIVDGDLPSLVCALAVLMRELQPHSQRLELDALCVPQGAVVRDVTGPEAAAHLVAMIGALAADPRVSLDAVERIGAAWNADPHFPLAEMEKVKKPAMIQMAKAASVEDRNYTTQKDLRAAILRAHHGSEFVGRAHMPSLAWVTKAVEFSDDGGVDDADELGEPGDAAADLAA